MMRKMTVLATVAAVLAAVVVLGGGTAASSGSSADMTLSSAGVTRNYLLHVPPQKASKPALVLVLHGGGADGHTMQGLTQFDRIADASGFVVAYPDAVGGKQGGWELGCCNARNRATTDLRFLGKLIDHLAATQGISRRRVYVTGFSLGAAMSYRVACELSSRVAAIASVGGFEFLSKRCTPHRPVAVYEIHGTTDYYGGSCGGDTQTNQGCGFGTPGYEPSVRQTNRQWRKLDRCKAKHKTSSFGMVTRNVWTRCAGTSAVQLDTIANGPHCYPRPNTCANYDATAAIWRFFKSRRLNRAGTASP